MSTPETPPLGLAVLARLAALGPVSPAPRAAPVTRRGAGVTFSADLGYAAHHSDINDLSGGAAGVVTPAHPLPPQTTRSVQWAERAALLEVDGGWPRALAEVIADRLLALEAAGAGPEAWAALDAELIALEAEREGRDSPTRSIPQAGSPDPVAARVLPPLSGLRPVEARPSASLSLN